MPTTEGPHITVSMDGLRDVRTLEMLLARIEARLERLKALADEVGIPLALLIDSERDRPEPSTTSSQPR